MMVTENLMQHNRGGGWMWGPRREAGFPCSCSSGEQLSTWIFQISPLPLIIITINQGQNLHPADVLILLIRWSCCSTLRESRFSRILENFFPISLLDLDLEAFSFHFSLSISISRHFHFTFHSRNEWKEKQIHFSFLEKSESISDFTLFLEKKEWIMHVLSWKI